MWPKLVSKLSWGPYRLHGIIVLYLKSSSLMYSVSFNPIIFDNAYPSLVFSNLSVKRSSSFIGLLKLLGVGFGYFGFIYSLNRSVKISPNPGYSKSIVAGSTLIVPFVSQYLFRNSFLNIQQWVAMFFSIGAMGYIAQPTKEELKMEHCH